MAGAGKKKRSRKAKAKREKEQRQKIQPVSAFDGLDDEVVLNLILLQQNSTQFRARLVGLQSLSLLPDADQTHYLSVLEANLRSYCVARKGQKPTVCPLTLRVPEGTGSHVIPRLVLKVLKDAGVPLFHLGKLRLQSIDRAVFYSYADAAEVAMSWGENQLAPAIHKLVKGDAIQLDGRQAELFVYSLFTVVWRTFAMSVPTCTDHHLRKLMMKSLFALRTRVLDTTTKVDSDGFIRDESGEYFLGLSVAVMPRGAQPYSVPVGATAVPGQNAYTSCTVLGYLAVFATVSDSPLDLSPQGSIALTEATVHLCPETTAFSDWTSMLLCTLGLDDIANFAQYLQQ